MHCTIVIPAFNESARITKTLTEIYGYMKQTARPFDLIVIDDGSTDDTTSVVERVWKDFDCEKTLIKNSKNFGKGYSVRLGMGQGRGDYCFFMDADQSTPIQEIEKLIAELDRGFHIAVGSRSLPRSKVEIRQDPKREAMGRVFNLMVRLFCVKGIQDTQCGFKGFKREAALILFGRSKMKGFSFDVEILFLAQRMRFSVSEVPVVWRNDVHSKVRLLSDPFWMFLDLFRMHFLHFGKIRKG